MEAGTQPWWASPDLRHANFRYLSVLSMQLDYLRWPDSPVLMHLHSLVWLALCVWIAAVLYRRLFRREAGGALWAAGLAAVLYALDDAHALPAAYLANRNALLATFFGLLSLYCHMRWRDDGWRAGAVLAPSCFALALLSAELGVSTIALLGAWALILDGGSWRARLLSLAPHGGVALAWFLVYRLGGFGARGSGVYVDPLGDPAGFTALLVDRSLALILGQWTPFPADLAFVLDLGTSEAWGLRLAALILVVVLAWLFIHVLRLERRPLRGMGASGRQLGSRVAFATGYLRMTPDESLHGQPTPPLCAGGDRLHRRPSLGNQSRRPRWRIWRSTSRANSASASSCAAAQPSRAPNTTSTAVMMADHASHHTAVRIERRYSTLACSRSSHVSSRAASASRSLSFMSVWSGTATEAPKVAGSGSTRPGPPRQNQSGKLSSAATRFMRSATTSASLSAWIGLESADGATAAALQIVTLSS